MGKRQGENKRDIVIPPTPVSDNTKGQYSINQKVITHSGYDYILSILLKYKENPILTIENTLRIMLDYIHTYNVNVIRQSYIVDQYMELFKWKKPNKQTVRNKVGDHLRGLENANLIKRLTPEITTCTHNRFEILF